MKSIKELVTGNKVRFMHYRKGELWYEVVEEKKGHVLNYETVRYNQLFTFPVPIEDCGDGQFNREDKAILFMRYIRKQLDR